MSNEMPRNSTTSARLKKAVRAVTSAAERVSAARSSTPRRARDGKKVMSAADRSMTSRSVASHVTVEGITQFSSSAKDEYVCGADYLGPVYIPATVTPGKVVSNLLVTPTGIAARLAAIANLWERYQFEYLELVYNPSVPTTTQGQLILTYDPDAVDLTPAGDARAFALATDDNITGPIYAPFSLVVRNLDKNTLYYTRDANAEDRFEIQGQFYVVYSGTAPTTGFECGTLSLRYKVRFVKRCYEVALPAAAPAPDSYTSWIETPIDVPSAYGVLGDIFNTVGQPFVNELKLETKGILLGRGLNYLRTVISGYPKSTGVAAVNLLLQSILHRLSDSKRATMNQSTTFGTVFSTSQGAETDFTTTMESAVTQIGVTVGATNHLLSYVAVNVDCPGTYYLDYHISSSGSTSFMATGYSVERLDQVTFERYCSYIRKNEVSAAPWTAEGIDDYVTLPTVTCEASARTPTVVCSRTPSLLRK